MKKLIYIFILLLIVGCNNLSNTPKKQVEEFFKKYQSLDKDVIADLTETINVNDTWTTDQKIKYEKIMKKHYQNLAYKIKEEVVDGDGSVVTVEIEVTNFRKTINEAEQYLQNNQSYFYDDDVYNNQRYNDYLLEKLESSIEKIKYTLNISLTKTDNKWKLNTLPDSIYDKINGIYNY